ncbi:hypothetical protein BAE30_03175 [Acidithiobacillus caldus]|uniref:DUF2079 domain-containing protein n=1 Tax=Acidithiobacillus caldus TaxID=33059 RepID=A0A1E7Z0A5_9PROT|nr:hypothetical protein BAE30_03175 [Acidithiobacillus caldus]
MKVFWANRSNRGFVALGLAIGLGAINPAIAVAIFSSFRTLPARIRDIIHSDLARPEGSAWVLWIVAFGVVAAFALAHPVPGDDLLKDLVSSYYGFDYRKAFWASDLLTRHDQYIGFDLLASWVHAHLPERFAFLPFQWFLILGYLAVQAKVYPSILSGRYYRYAWSALLTILVWLQPEFIERVVSGRPESIMALWAFAALAADTPWLVAIWAIGGAFLMPSYWLAGVYIPAVLLLPRLRLSTRLVVGVCLSVVFVAFWGIYSDWRWPFWLLELHKEIGLRQEAVAENLGLSLAIYAPAFLIALLLFWRFHDGLRRVSWELWAVLTWFLIPDMIRYVDILAVILSVILARSMAAMPDALALDQNWPGAFAVLAAVFWMQGQVSPSQLSDVHIAGYRPGQKVLTVFGPLTYDTLYENPGIRLAPAMELGATAIPVQKASVALQNGKVSCAFLNRYHVSYIVEDTLQGTPKSCLKLLSVSKGVRVWEVKKSREEK